MLNRRVEPLPHLEVTEVRSVSVYVLGLSTERFHQMSKVNTQKRLFLYVKI